MKTLTILLSACLLTYAGYAQSLLHPWHVVDHGGGKAAYGDFNLNTSIGQPNVAKMVYIDTGSIIESGYIPGLRSYQGPGMAYNQILKEGWNLASLPLIVSDPRKIVLYPSASSDAFIYTTSYISIDTIRNGEGFWIKYPASASIPLAGTAFFLDTISVNSGWNLIGVPASVVPVGNIITIGTSIITEYFGYDNAYYAEDSLYPGNGYWIKTSGSGQLVLISAAMSTPTTPATASLISGLKLSSSKKGINPLEQDPNMNQIIIRDASGQERKLYFSVMSNNIDPAKYELPPPPPNEALDVRYSTNRYVEIADPEKEKVTSISILSAEFPLTIEWKIPTDIQGASLRVNGKEFGITADGSIYVYELNSMPKLRLNALSPLELPKAFALHQNYPNPFNPTTNIKYDLPVSGRVVIKVYDVIGQEIATLSDGVQEAGYKSVGFDAGKLPSGVYVYRLTAGIFNDVKKMIVVK